MDVPETKAISDQLSQVQIADTKDDVDEPTLSVKASTLNESAAEPEVSVDKEKEKDTPYLTKTATDFRQLSHLLTPEILSAVAELNYNRPSKIQAIAIPIILSDPPVNFIGQAQSGSGKTAAFGLSMLGRVDQREEGVQAICIAPTRELTRQIHDNLTKLAKNTAIKVLLALSDTAPKFSPSVNSQVVIATPGTLIGMMDKRLFDPRKVKIFVLDEADELLRSDGQSTENQARKIISRLNPKCQVCLFSATYNDKVRNFADSIVKSPKKQVTIRPEELTLDKLFQYYVKCAAPTGEDLRLKVLDDIITTFTVGQSIIFVHTINTANKVFAFMKSRGHEIALLYGRGMEESQRDKTIDEFRAAKSRTLISTNVIARGLDVLRVTMVINYDVPMDKDGNPDPETYLHRIGRSARWQNSGVAVTFVHNKESHDKLHFIAKHYNKVIDEKKMDVVATTLAQELKAIGLSD